MIGDIVAADFPCRRPIPVTRTIHVGFRLLATAVGLRGQAAQIYHSRTRPKTLTHGAAPSELERLLVQARADPSQQSRLGRELAKSDLYVALPEAPKRTGSRTVQCEEELRILTVPGPGGSPVPAAFTSEAGLAEVFGCGAGFVKMKGDVLLSLLSGGGVMINPGLRHTVHWTAADLAAVLGRPVQHVVERGTKFLLGIPGEWPEALIAHLARWLDDDPRINEAWLALAHWPATCAWSWYLDVRSDADGETLSHALSDATKQLDLGDRPIDMVVNSPDEEEGIGIKIKPLQPRGALGN
ncbi:enhanced serine sensitivity protein SseB C-terminal domain-containing protein [Rhodoligotrophos defluvii]|uniref:enhanced serine sensitivity protein SseB C-terminal domain-containing protein n=1 Tax=Rhodoligotrophos defluvii TaxID=2561934 RepID=UPI00195FD625|nr:enhanced serine sensitivity protein SseB C-terminal domain-containing protein [Rhodoligotrophos defluvii]